MIVAAAGAQFIVIGANVLMVVDDIILSCKNKYQSASGERRWNPSTLEMGYELKKNADEMYVMLFLRSVRTEQNAKRNVECLKTYLRSTLRSP